MSDRGLRQDNPIRQGSCSVVWATSRVRCAREKPAIVYKSGEGVLGGMLVLSSTSQGWLCWRRLREMLSVSWLRQARRAEYHSVQGYLCTADVAGFARSGAQQSCLS